MARYTASQIDEIVLSHLRDAAGVRWSPDSLEIIRTMVVREVSQKILNSKRYYCTTTGTAKEVNVSQISGFISAKKCEIQADQDPPQYHQLGPLEANILALEWATTPTAIVLAVSDGTGCLLGTTASAHGLSVGYHVTFTGTTNYNATYTILTVPSTTTFTVAGTYGADEAGYIGQLIRIFANTEHTLGPTAASNTLPVDGEDLVVQGMVAHANREWVGEFRAFVDQAAAAVSTTGNINATIDLATPRIAAALAYIESGDDYIDTVPIGGNPVGEFVSYAGAELATAAKYLNQAKSFHDESSANIAIANLVRSWQSHADRLMFEYREELKDRSRAERRALYPRG